MNFGVATQNRPHAKSGKVRCVAIAGDDRLKNNPDFKDVRSMKEFGYPKVDFTLERIFMAPAGIPDDRLAVLRKGIDAPPEKWSALKYVF